MTILTFYPLAHFYLGNAYLQRGELDKALEEYGAGLAYPALSFLANEEARKVLYLSMGVAYFRQGKYGEAEDAWSRVLAMDPQNQTARRNLDVINEMRERR
jgi:tetratricopeptide (TPR) repeat protein